MQNLRIYQYNICPFCNKTKAALEFLKVPYKVTEVDPLTRSQIKFSKEYKKVPIATFGGADSQVLVTGSTEIVDKVLQYAEMPPSIDKEHFLSKEALEWTKWCDDEFAVTVYPNITRSVGECWHTLKYLHSCGEFSAPRAYLTRALGAVGMAMAHGKIKKKYNMADERQALYDVVDKWVEAVDDKLFRGGVKPDLSDLAVYGCLRGISMVPLYNELLQHDSFGPWFGRMKALVDAAEAE